MAVFSPHMHFGEQRIFNNALVIDHYQVSGICCKRKMSAKIATARTLRSHAESAVSNRCIIVATYNASTKKERCILFFIKNNMQNKAANVFSAERLSPLFLAAARWSTSQDVSVARKKSMEARLAARFAMPGPYIVVLLNA